ALTLFYPSSVKNRHLPSAWACRNRSKYGSSSNQRLAVSVSGGPYASRHISPRAGRGELGLRTASDTSRPRIFWAGLGGAQIEAKKSRTMSRTGSKTLFRRMSSFCRLSKTPGGPVDAVPAPVVGGGGIS